MPKQLIAYLDSPQGRIFVGGDGELSAERYSLLQLAKSAVTSSTKEHIGASRTVSILETLRDRFGGEYTVLTDGKPYPPNALLSTTIPSNFNELHPRVGKGDPRGGEFTKKEKAGYESAEDLTDADDAAKKWKEMGVRSPYFKAWFGDWENKPEEASKAVNDSGHPQATWPLEEDSTYDSFMGAYDKAREESVKAKDGIPIRPIIVYRGAAVDSDILENTNAAKGGFYGAGMYFAGGVSEAIGYIGNTKKEITKEDGFKFWDKAKDIISDRFIELDKKIEEAKASGDSEKEEEYKSLHRNLHFQVYSNLADHFDKLKKGEGKFEDAGYIALQLPMTMKAFDAMDQKVIKPNIKTYYLRIKRPFYCDENTRFTKDELIDFVVSAKDKPRDERMADLSKRFLGKSGAYPKDEAERDDWIKQLVERWADAHGRNAGEYWDGDDARDAFIDVYSWDEESSRVPGPEVFRRTVADKGYDGIITKKLPGQTDVGRQYYITWNPTSIKSTENKGTFDPKEKSSMLATGTLVGPSRTEFKPELHPRFPKGDKRGGEFSPKGYRTLDHRSSLPAKGEGEKVDEVVDADEAAREWRERGVYSRTFKKWFGDWENDTAYASKVVNESGKPQLTYKTRAPRGVLNDYRRHDPESPSGHPLPLIVYHGAGRDFDSFDLSKSAHGNYGQAFYFATNRNEANEYRHGSGEAGMDDEDIKTYIREAKKVLDFDNVDDDTKIGLETEFEKMKNWKTPSPMAEQLRRYPQLESVIDKLKGPYKPETKLFYLKIVNPLVSGDTYPISEFDRIVDLYPPPRAKWALEQGHSSKEDYDQHIKIMKDFQKSHFPGGKITGSNLMGMLGAVYGYSRDVSNQIRLALDAGGYDGIIIRDEHLRQGQFGNHYIVWRPEQIKLLYNKGTFDPHSPNSMLSSFDPVKHPRVRKGVRKGGQFSKRNTQYAMGGDRDFTKEDAKSLADNAISVAKRTYTDDAHKKFVEGLIDDFTDWAENDRTNDRLVTLCDRYGDNIKEAIKGKAEYAGIDLDGLLDDKEAETMTPEEELEEKEIRSGFKTSIKSDPWPDGEWSRSKFWTKGGYDMGRVVAPNFAFFGMLSKFAYDAFFEIVHGGKAVNKESLIAKAKSLAIPEHFHEEFAKMGLKLKSNATELSSHGKGWMSNDGDEKETESIRSGVTEKLTKPTGDKAFDLTQKNKSRFSNAMSNAIYKMPPAYVRKFSEEVGDVYYSNTTDPIREVYENEAGPIDPSAGDPVALTHFNSKDGGVTGKSDMHLDGLGSLEGRISDEELTRVYLHESAHVVDPGKFKDSKRGSQSEEWVEAWNDEVWRSGGSEMGVPASISEYARTHPAEGWAEFGALLMTKPLVAVTLFPRCYNFWKSEGLV